MGPWQRVHKPWRLGTGLGAFEAWGANPDILRCSSILPPTFSLSQSLMFSFSLLLTPPLPLPPLSLPPFSRPPLSGQAWLLGPGTGSSQGPVFSISGTHLFLSLLQLLPSSTHFCWFHFANPAVSVLGTTGPAVSSHRWLTEAGDMPWSHEA